MAANPFPTPSIVSHPSDPSLPSRFFNALKDSQDCLPGHFSLPPMFHSGKGNGKDREKGRLFEEINEKYDGGKSGALFHLMSGAFFG